MRALLGSTSLLVELSNVKFVTLLSPYDRVYLEGEVLSKRVTSKGNRVLVTYATVVKNQEKAVAVI